MKKGFSWVLFLLLFVPMGLLPACQTTNEINSPGVDIAWELVTNGYQDKNQFLSRFTITNNGDTDFGNNWELFFSLNPRDVIPGPEPTPLTIQHINGDFYKLSPNENYTAIKPGESLEFEYVSNLWAIKTVDAPNNPYFILDGDADNPLALKERFTLVPFTRENQNRKGVSDILPRQIAETNYEENAKLTTIPKRDLTPIVPTPISFERKEGAPFELNESTKIVYVEGLENEAKYLSERIKEDFNLQLPFSVLDERAQNEIRLEFLSVPPMASQESTSGENYRLEVSSEAVSITGLSAPGIFYGVQSLRSLALNSLELEPVTVNDGPRFPYRGMHFDVSRNFHSKKQVLKMLELLSFYKINTFHFHLTDDEGWRLEIDGLPELTEIGSVRAHPSPDNLPPAYGSGGDVPNRGTGFYTKEDYIEILQYAKARHIEVIPEIDLPGHARAAIVAMERRYEKFKAAGNMEAAEEYLLNDFEDESVYNSAQYYNDNTVCVGRESVYTFIDKVVGEFVKLHKQAGVKLTSIHSGGDEVAGGVWMGSPINQKFLAENEGYEDADDLGIYFLERVGKILNKYNLIHSGWEEIAMKKVPVDGVKQWMPYKPFVEEKFRPYVWNSIFGWGGEDLAYQLANDGFEVVLCNASNLYFDVSYDNDPNEPGLYWPGFVNTRSNFDFAPYNLFNTATLDLMGNPLSPTQLIKGKKLLKPEAKKNIIGIQCQLWSETMYTDKHVEEASLPKLIGFSERAWAQQPTWEEVENFTALEADWNQFANRVSQYEFSKLETVGGGFIYRIPLPGAIIEDGILKANAEFPGLVIRFTEDGSEPNDESEIYLSPTAVKGKVKLKAFAPTGRSSRSIEVGGE